MGQGSPGQGRGKSAGLAWEIEIGADCRSLVIGLCRWPTHSLWGPDRTPQDVPTKRSRRPSGHGKVFSVAWKFRPAVESPSDDEDGRQQRCSGGADRAAWRCSGRFRSARHQRTRDDPICAVPESSCLPQRSLYVLVPSLLPILPDRSLVYPYSRRSRLKFSSSRQINGVRDARINGVRDARTTSSEIAPPASGPMQCRRRPPGPNRQAGVASLPSASARAPQGERHPRTRCTGAPSAHLDLRITRQTSGHWCVLLPRIPLRGWHLRRRRILRPLRLVEAVMQLPHPQRGHDYGKERTTNRGKHQCNT